MSELRLGSHTGTHVDAPRHLVAGAAGVDELLLEVLCGPARVADLRGAGMRLDARVLEESAARFAGERGGWPERLLLRTDTEALERGRFHRGYAHLTRDAAELLRDRGVRLVGIDSWSVDPWSDDEAFAFPAHHALLDPRADREPVVIVECLELSGAQQGDWELVCLPLRIEGGDGAPARAVLRRVG
jgi:arylformamidase